jgi:hypothetical protein
MFRASLDFDFWRRTGDYLDKMCEVPIQPSGPPASGDQPQTVRALGLTVPHLARPL